MCQHQNADTRQSYAYPLNLLPLVGTVMTLLASALYAHEFAGHSGPTYSVAASVNDFAAQSHLKLNIVEEETGRPTAARFSFSIDGKPYIPSALGEHGLIFTSIHKGKKQQFVVAYARGTGAVEVPLPAGTQRGMVTITKGYEYFLAEASFEVVDGVAETTALLRQWSSIQQEGWLPADAHLHYDRSNPTHDSDWLTMLAADGLAHSHFMVLKGGNLPGIWAEQFAYGKAGEAADGERWIRAGEEYRDSFQGHINLLGLNAIITPISTGGIGPESPHYHYPPLHDVLLQARELGGIVGPAHGATLGRSTTGIADAVLGAVDFFEIANTHLYMLDAWYALLNCGYVIPPAAGTDLPNFPYRDVWQPFLGETRMYVKLGKQRDFEAWKNAVKKGAVFITSGPMLRLSVNGFGPGGQVRLPERGGEILIEAELSSTRPLQAFEIICNGIPLSTAIERKTDNGIHQWRIQHRLKVMQNSWIAARGVGAHKTALEEHTGIQQDAVAHSAAVRVLLDKQPIGSSEASKKLIQQLQGQKEYYKAKGKFENKKQRSHLLRLFDDASAKLKNDVEKSTPPRDDDVR